MSETGIYLYAVARDLPPGTVGGATGLRGAPLSQVAVGRLTAVVSEVDLAEFGEEGLRRNLEDLGWLEEVARTHDAVVHLVSEHASVAPMRLATVFLTPDSLRQRAGEWAESLHTALDRVEGCQEWSVKVVVDTTAQAAAAPDGPTGGQAGSPGAAYLQRRREQLGAQQRAQEAAARTGDDVHAALVEGVVASRRLPPQDRRLAGYEGTMVLNAAYLVSRSGAEEWLGRVEGLRARLPRATIEVRGPWPPYSFATLEGTG